MEEKKYNLLLADDDYDDRFFFKEALNELPLASTLTTVNDGVDLMAFLTEKIGNLPDMLFLDLNMPRKTGYECLSEIKSDQKLKALPVIIISTSFEHDVVNSLYKKGADFYLRKPADFSVLKESINKAVSLAAAYPQHRSKNNFVINGSPSSILNHDPILSFTTIQNQPHERSKKR